PPPGSNTASRPWRVSRTTSFRLRLPRLWTKAYTRPSAAKAASNSDVLAPGCSRSTVPSASLSRIRHTWAGDSTTAKTTPAPPRTNTGSALVRPSVVRRTGSEEFMDHPPPGQHAQLGPRLGGQAHRVDDGGADHGGRDRLGQRVLAKAVALADHPAGADAGPGPEGEIAVGPVVARRLGVDPRRPAELAQADDQRGLQQA